MTPLRITAAALALALTALYASPSEAACRSPNKHEMASTETRQKIEALCTDLPNALDFWVSGHEGHYPKSERASGYAKMTRVLCDDGAGGPDIIVGAVQNDNLELFCLDPGLRGGGDTAVNALNTVLEAAGVNDRQVKWISSNNPNTQNFYKSLNVSCGCETHGSSGKGATVRFMQFTASSRQHPIAKKPRHTIPGPGQTTYRVLFDACMSDDEFAKISGALTAGHVTPVPPKYATSGNVLASVMVREGYIFINGQDETDNDAWLDENPTKCK